MRHVQCQNLVRRLYRNYRLMAECLSPIRLPDTGQVAPCGRCYNCLARRASAWSIRLYQESLVATSCYFLTLTYDNAHIPLTRSGFMDLDKQGLQKFFKRLRFSDTGRRRGDIRYYAAAEYGGRSFRPHYHILLFNCPLELILGVDDAKFVKRSILHLDGKTPYLCPAWYNSSTHLPFGHITVGTVTLASIGYCLKYMQKSKRIPLHINDDRTPEFALMSKGLGKSYLTSKMIAWHKADLVNRMYCHTVDGKKVSMPRYYKDKMYTADERQEILINFLKTEREPHKLDDYTRMMLSAQKLAAAEHRGKIL